MIRFRSIIDWIRNREIVVLLACFVVVAGTWALIEWADAVLEKGTQSFDDRIILALHHKDGTPIGPPWLREVGRDITALGGVAVISGLTAIVAGFLLMRKQYHAMWLVLIAVFGGLVISS